MLEANDFCGRGDGTASKSTSEARAAGREDDPTRLAKGEEGYCALEKYVFAFVTIGPPCSVQELRIRGLDMNATHQNRRVPSTSRLHHHPRIWVRRSFVSSCYFQDVCSDRATLRAYRRG